MLEKEPVNTIMTPSSSVSGVTVTVVNPVVIAAVANLHPDTGLVCHTAVVPLELSTVPEAPNASLVFAPEVPPKIKSPSAVIGLNASNAAVAVVCPVPPLAIGSVPPVPPLAVGRTPVTDELAKSTAEYSMPLATAELACKTCPSVPKVCVVRVVPLLVSNCPWAVGLTANVGLGYVPVRSPPAAPVVDPLGPCKPPALNCLPVAMTVVGAALPGYPRFVSTTVVASVTLLTVRYPASSTYTVCPVDNHAVLPTDTDTVLDTAGIVNPLVVVV